MVLHALATDDDYKKDANIFNAHCVKKSLPGVIIPLTVVPLTLCNGDQVYETKRGLQVSAYRMGVGLGG